MKEIKFIIYGNPVAKGRPRFTRKGFTYTPKKTVTAENDFKLQSLQFKPAKPLTSEIVLQVFIYREIPKSLSKKKRIMANDGLIRPVSRPDCDNYAKLVLDSMNGIFFKDDSQVVELIVGKFYSDKPRIEVNLIGYE